MMFKKLFLSLFMAVMLSTGLAFAADNINVNTATKAELIVVKGIGDGTADAIIKYREENGPFKNLDELVNVKGIGEKKVAKWTDTLSVEQAFPLDKLQGVINYLVTPFLLSVMQNN